MDSMHCKTANRATACWALPVRGMSSYMEHTPQMAPCLHGKRLDLLCRWTIFRHGHVARVFPDQVLRKANPILDGNCARLLCLASSRLVEQRHLPVPCILCLRAAFHKI